MATTNLKYINLLNTEPTKIVLTSCASFRQNLCRRPTEAYQYSLLYFKDLNQSQSVQNKKLINFCELLTVNRLNENIVKDCLGKSHVYCI